MPLALRFKSWHKKAGWLLAELVVVFVGVFAASLLTDYREEQGREARREQVHQMLLDEVRFMEGQYRSAAAFVDSLFVEGFIEPYEQGKRPDVRPLDLTVGMPISKDLWNAMLQTGGLDALDPETLQLAQLYFTLQASTLKWATETSERSNRTIAPRLAGGDAAFYLPDTTALSPAYAWYPRSIRRLHSGMEQMALFADSLHRHLDSLPRTGGARTDADS